MTFGPEHLTENALRLRSAAVDLQLDPDLSPLSVRERLQLALNEIGRLRSVVDSIDPTGREGMPVIADKDLKRLIDKLESIAVNFWLMEMSADARSIESLLDDISPKSRDRIAAEVARVTQLRERSRQPA